MARRSFLQVGTVAGLGFTLGDWFRLQSARAAIKQYDSKEGKAKSVIHIFLPGGIAHQESFDPKPFAPVEYRGPLGTVKTKLDGVLFSQNLPKTAQVEFDVVLLPGGEVLGVKLRKSSALAAYDNAVERAILKAQPLPLPPDPAMFKEFRELNLIFRPQE